METKLNIYQKLLKIQISVMGLKKDKKSNTYEYVTGTKVLEHIKPLMNDLGLLLKQEVISIDNERMDYKTGIGTNYEKPKSEILSKVMMRFTWVDTENGTFDVNEFGANGQNEWEKGLGSALTYAERYFLLKYFHIATDEDDIDNDSRKKEDNTPSQQQKEPSKTSNPLAKTVAPPTKEELNTEIAKINAIPSATGLTGYYNALTNEYKADETIIQALKDRREAIKVKTT